MPTVVTTTTTTTMSAGVTPLATGITDNDYIADIVAYDGTDEDRGSTSYDDDIEDAYLLKQWDLVPSSMITDGDVSPIPQPSARGDSSHHDDDVSEGRGRPTSSPAASGKVASRGKGLSGGAWSKQQRPNQNRGRQPQQGQSGSSTGRRTSLMAAIGSGGGGSRAAVASDADTLMDAEGFDGRRDSLSPEGWQETGGFEERPPCFRSGEHCIKQHLFNNGRDAGYDKTTRPVKKDNTTTVLHVGMSLYHILDTNEKYQTLTSLVAVRLMGAEPQTRIHTSNNAEDPARWIDEYLKWNASDFNSVDQIWIPADHIWTPDIFVSNFVDDSFRDCMGTNVIVSADGHVLWMFPAVVKTYCTLDVQHFPFDQQKCSLVFISWTFNGNKLNVTFNESEHQAVYYTPRVAPLGTRHEKVYACCPEPYPDVTFTIHMKRRSLFYVINLIFPCLLIYAVSFLGFFLPVESGEKINLETTILLALVVFLLIVGILFGLTMIMVSIALVMAVIVTNIFMRKDTDSVMPNYLRCIFLRNRSRIEKLQRQQSGRIRSSLVTSAAAPENKDSATVRRQYLISLSPDDNRCDGKDSHENELTKMATVSGHLDELADSTVRAREVDPDSLSVLSRLGSFRNGVDGSGNRLSLDKGRERTLSNSDDADAGPWTLAAQVTPLMTTSFIGLRRSKRLSESNRPLGTTTVAAMTAGRADGTSGAAGGDGAVELTAEQLEAQIEWQELARIVDRVFFWVFMLSSIGILAVLSYSIMQR